jgi:hypothetical protein
MSTYLDLTFEGRPSRFSMRPVDRAGLLGAKRRIALDAHGNECATAWLTRDGQHLLRTGSFADLYATDHGDSVERRELVPLDHEGRPLTLQRSTRCDAQALVGPVSLEELLDQIVTRAYTLSAETVDPTLEHALRAGSLFRVAFRPRKTVHATPAFLLANALGSFLLQVEPCGFTFVAREQLALVTDDDTEDAPGFDEWWDFPNPEDGGLPDAA